MTASYSQTYNITLRKMVPLYCLLPRAEFRIQGKKRIYTKIDNLATFPIQNYDENGKTTTVTYENACYCKTSSGRVIIKKWFDFVEEVS